MQTFSGMDYLRIDVASQFGLDKLTWNQRLSWFKEHEDHLEDLLSKAEEPAMYYAAVKAYRMAQRGTATGYMVSLDATASGLQVLACMTGDEEAASLCNVIHAGERADAYTIIYNAMLATVGDTAKVSREQCKQAIMTSLYGSTAMPKQVFGEGEMLKAFEWLMSVRAPYVWELNKIMLDAWDPTALHHTWWMPDDHYVHIKVMNTVNETVHFLNEPFQVPHKVNTPKAKGRSLCANMTHSVDGMIVRELVRRCSFHPPTIQYVRELFDGTKQLRMPQKDPEATNDNDHMVMRLWDHYKACGYLSARILDNLTEHNAGYVDEEPIMDLIQSLPKKPFSIMPIHDCFRVHPNYGDDLRRQYIYQLHLLTKSTMLNYLLSQMMGKKLDIIQPNLNMAEKVLETEFALS
jgi:hypothetical protein